MNVLYYHHIKEVKEDLHSLVDYVVDKICSKERVLQEGLVVLPPKAVNMTRPCFQGATHRSLIYRVVPHKLHGVICAVSQLL